MIRKRFKLITLIHYLWNSHFASCRNREKDRGEKKERNVKEKESTEDRDKDKEDTKDVKDAVKTEVKKE